jgi:hypothetical protein
MTGIRSLAQANCSITTRAHVRMQIATRTAQSMRNRSDQNLFNSKQSYIHLSLIVSPLAVIRAFIPVAVRVTAVSNSVYVHCSALSI